MEADDFSTKKIIRVFQRIQTVVEFEELRRDNPGLSFRCEIVVDSHDRPLPDPEPVEVN